MADNNNSINNIILNVKNLNVILGNEKIVEDLDLKVKKKNF
jgi:ABC-type Mn2+/Zn2+ transport system ATPase subunit